VRSNIGSFNGKKRSTAQLHVSFYTLPWRWCVR